MVRFKWIHDKGFFYRLVSIPEWAVSKNRYFLVGNLLFTSAHKVNNLIFIPCSFPHLPWSLCGSRADWHSCVSLQRASFNIACKVRMNVFLLNARRGTQRTGQMNRYGIEKPHERMPFLWTIEWDNGLRAWKRNSVGMVSAAVSDQPPLHTMHDSSDSFKKGLSNITFCIAECARWSLYNSIELETM